MRLPALTTVGAGGLNVSNNNALTTLSLPALTTVNGNLSVTGNPVLRQCLVDAIKNELTTGPSTYSATGNNGMPNTCP